MGVCNGQSHPRKTPSKPDDYLTASIDTSDYHTFSCDFILMQIIDCLFLTLSYILKMKSRDSDNNLLDFEHQDKGGNVHTDCMCLKSLAYLILAYT